jgi:hypothetical protein
MVRLEIRTMAVLIYKKIDYAPYMKRNTFGIPNKHRRKFSEASKHRVKFELKEYSAIKTTAA